MVAWTVVEEEEDKRDYVSIPYLIKVEGGCIPTL